jgi:hypothetical protein
MLREQSTEVTNADAKTIGESADCPSIQCAILNEPERASYDGGSSCPGRRSRGGLGSAAQTRSISGFRGLLRCRVIPDVRVIGKAGWAYRAAVNPRGSDGNEEPTVKTRIAAATRSIENVPRQARNSFHELNDSPPGRWLLAIFGCDTSIRPPRLILTRSVLVVSIDQHIHRRRCNAIRDDLQDAAKLAMAELQLTDDYQTAKLPHEVGA